MRYADDAFAPATRHRSGMANLEAQFEQWQKRPPRDLIGDPLWRMTAYRISLFMADLVRLDARRLFDQGAPSHKVTQLESSVESVEANISEGYSKFSGKDRARFFEMALASAREARGWYRRSSQWLGTEEADERRMLLTQVIKILTVAIPRERSGGSERRIRRARKPHRENPASDGES
ncbi:MAG: four helix bundle protein [Bryobacteraceae bacterium]